MTLNDDLSRVFKEEATELIEALMDLIAQLARSDGALFEKRLEETLRTAHNLKGAATSTGFSVVETLAHALEGVLGRHRNTEGPLKRDVVECAVEALSIMQISVDGEISETEVHEISDRLVSMGGEVIKRTVETKPKAESSDEKVADAAEPKAADEFFDKTTKSKGGGNKLDTSKQDSAIRVDTARLDLLMSFIGEFLTFRARLEERYQRQADIFKQLYDVHRAHRETFAELDPITRRLRRLVREGRKDLLDFTNLTDTMNDTAKQLRTVPIRGAVPLWRRIVRESSQICGKDVGLEVSVGRVEIDRFVLERIHDPMMHILRNAVDHGIEFSTERAHLGKPPRGHINISATVQGAMIRLEISDDGAGINFEKVRRKAVENQLITSEQAERMSVAQTADLLFRTGFSTTNQVNRLSGRGVGLDVVRTQLEGLGGSVEVLPNPTLGGTTIVLWVPVSILSSEGLFVRCGNAVYALPIESVVRTIRVGHGDVKTLDGRPVVKVGSEDPIRVAWLSKVMGFETKDRSESVNIVVLSRGKREIGVIVDQVIGLREYVIHGLPWNYNGFPGVNGAILEADGSVALLVDVLHLFEGNTVRGNVFRSGASKTGESQKVLLVDDSLSSRTLQRAMLRADGYDVTLAADGHEAWEILQNGEFDLVVSDIQMPKMDGFELTKRIRAATRFKDLPVILVTSLNSPEGRTAGAEAGADDYLVKGTFDQHELLSIVSKYLGKQ